MAEQWSSRPKPLVLMRICLPGTEEWLSESPLIWVNYFSIRFPEWVATSNKSSTRNAGRLIYQVSAHRPCSYDWIIGLRQAILYSSLGRRGPENVTPGRGGVLLRLSHPQRLQIEWDGTTRCSHSWPKLRELLECMHHALSNVTWHLKVGTNACSHLDHRKPLGIEYIGNGITVEGLVKRSLHSLWY